MDKKKGKINLLFIIWSFTYGGGAERVLSTLVNSLDKDKYNIDILEYWHSNINNEHVNNNVKLLNPVVDSIKENRISKVFKMMLLYIKPSILRKKYIRKNYDVEISYNYLIPTFLIKKTGKTIAWIHGDVYDLLDNKLKYYFQKKALKNVNYIVAISKKTFNSIIEVYPEYKDKTIIINNSYNFNTIIDKSNEFTIKKDEKLKQLLYLGRFDENKNPLYLIEVMKQLKEKKAMCKLIFMGCGDLKKQMEDKIEEYQLSNMITIMDYQKNPYPYIKQTDVIVGCSHSEGFPTVFVEGMIFGKPFVSTNVGGANELSNDSKCGLVAKTKEEYTDCLLELINNEEKYQKMSNECKKFVDKYSCEKQSKEVSKLIDNVLRSDINEK